MIEHEECYKYNIRKFLNICVKNLTFDRNGINNLMLPRNVSLSAVSIRGRKTIPSVVEEVSIKESCPFSVFNWRFLIIVGLLSSGVLCSKGQNATYDNLTANYTQVSGNVYVNSFAIDGYLVDYTGTIYSPANGTDATFGNLTITNSTVIGGNLPLDESLAIGSWWDGSQYWNGDNIYFQDNGDYTSSNIYFYGYSPNVTWLWQENGASTPKNQMLLDPTGNLTLTDATSGNTATFNPSDLTIILSPSGGSPQTLNWLDQTVNATITTLSLGSGGITLNSTADSLSLGNLTITGNSTSGNFKFTDARSLNYIYINPGNNSLIFSNGFSMSGNNTTENVILGSSGSAIGGDATASGNGSVALAGGTASASESIALGNNSIASGTGAVAMVGGNATGNNTLAIGISSNATASNSTAVGEGTSALYWGAIAVGHYNQVISGNSTAWQAQDAAFIVGIGNSTDAANGLVILNNGNATFSGNSTINQELEVNGASLLNGNVTFSGNVFFNEPFGNSPMGGFGN